MFCRQLLKTFFFVLAAHFRSETALYTCIFTFDIDIDFSLNIVKDVLKYRNFWARRNSLLSFDTDASS